MRYCHYVMLQVQGGPNQNTPPDKIQFLDNRVSPKVLSRLTVTINVTSWNKMQSAVCRILPLEAVKTDW